MQKLLPYINGWAFFLGLTLLLTIDLLTLNSFVFIQESTILNAIAGLMPGGMNNQVIALLVLTVPITVLVKWLDGPSKFSKLEHKLEKRPGVTNPAGLARYIGVQKYGKRGFARLSAAGRRKR